MRGRVAIINAEVPRDLTPLASTGSAVLRHAQDDKAES